MRPALAHQLGECRQRRAARAPPPAPTHRRWSRSSEPRNPRFQRVGVRRQGDRLERPARPQARGRPSAWAAGLARSSATASRTTTAATQTSPSRTPHRSTAANTVSSPDTSQRLSGASAAAAEAAGRRPRRQQSLDPEGHHVPEADQSDASRAGQPARGSGRPGVQDATGRRREAARPSEKTTSEPASGLSHSPASQPGGQREAPPVPERPGGRSSQATGGQQAQRRRAPAARRAPATPPAVEKAAPRSASTSGPEPSPRPRSTTAPRRRPPARALMRPACRRRGLPRTRAGTDAGDKDRGCARMCRGSSFLASPASPEEVPDEQLPRTMLTLPPAWPPTHRSASPCRQRLHGRRPGRRQGRRPGHHLDVRAAATTRSPDQLLAWAEQVEEASDGSLVIEFENGGASARPTTRPTPSPT